ncbi:hypothetical protein [Streptomyces odontomachi]|uniref:hypothetical protein n=1 Tax=Streptomyces odontomachi TaxID=2944940 RepID=UPI00210CBA53|nr:hypothetical protein [Streptomyces sp. ODS25]
MLDLLPANPASSTLYPEWVRCHASAGENGAERLLARVSEGIPRAHSKPGRFMDDQKRAARDLPPEHLPWFWDTVGHRLCLGLPRHAAKAYALAREAERTHSLPVDPDYAVANALLFARCGALSGAEVSAHQKWLATALPPEAAHERFTELLRACGAGGVTPPPDLHGRVRASARGAGLGVEEEARILGEALVAAEGDTVPAALLNGAARVFAKSPPPRAVQAVLAGLFPPTGTIGGAFLRLLRDSGTVDAMADGWVEPPGGLAAWLARFVETYEYTVVRPSSRGLVRGGYRQAMPDELYEDVLPRLAGRLRGQGTPVRLGTRLDADLVDACLALEIPVEHPGAVARLETEGCRRDLAALAAHPEWRHLLAGAAEPGKRGTAVTRLPEAAGVEKAVRDRIARQLDQVAHGGLGAAREALSRLDSLLDTPTSAALRGIGEALAGLDLTGPLLRTLRAGIPAELGWPALEQAVAELEAAGAQVEGVTCTWPVLTLYGGGRAIAVDHRGRRGACDVAVPAEAETHTVFHVGGDFLVGWRIGGRYNGAHHAYWASTPDEVFRPGNTMGLRRYASGLDGGLGYQFATADGRGRHDGERVLHPGERDGIGHFDQQMSDGTRVWSEEYLSDDSAQRRDRYWAEVDPDTGQRRPGIALPDFHTTAHLPDGWVRSADELTLVGLPDEVADSVLGHADGLSGFRVCHADEGTSHRGKHYRLEGTDGRHASYRRESAVPDHRDGDPWGIVRMPAGGADLVATVFDETRNWLTDVVIPCYAADDQSLLWEVRPFPRRNPSPDDHPPFPPPAFWHFLRPRDLDSSRALRTVSRDAVRVLLDAAAPGEKSTAAAPEGGSSATVRAALAKVLPGVTEPRVVQGVVAAVEQAALLLGRRRVLSERIATVGSGALVSAPEDVPDSALLGALRGLLPVTRPSQPTRQPATLTALAADGQYLRGAVDDRIRRLSLPDTPYDWTVLLGGIDAVAWRAAAAFTSDEDHAALTALLRVWAEQPWAAPGEWRRGRATGAALAPLCSAGGALVPGAPATEALDPTARYRFVQPVSAAAPEEAEDVTTVTVTRDDAARLRRLLELLATRGRLPLDEAAVAAFQERTGVRRAVAALVLAGLPRRANHGSDYTSNFDAHNRMLRSKPFQASKLLAQTAEDLSSRLGVAGRHRLLAAAVPDDPAELWTEGGTVAAARRMAEVWRELLGGGIPVDEETVVALENDLGQGAQEAAALADPAALLATTDMRCVLAADHRGQVEPYEVSADASRRKLYGFRRPYARLATLLAWALTERPVGTPATAAVGELYARLRARLDAPELLLPLGIHRLPHDLAGVFGPRTHPVEPPKEPRDEEAAHPVAYDTGLLVVDGRKAIQWPLVRPSGFSDADAVERTLRICRDHGLDGLRADLDRLRVYYDGGLSRMVTRAADTPVPPGGHEADPRLSVPELVQQAADELGTGTDAAALYLQLLTLARPTDRNVRTWNGWRPTHHKKVQAELLDHGLVVEAKRSRAGRSVFLPGGWTVPKAPELPLETAKLHTHMATVTDKKEIEGPFSRLLPPAPLHEMFTAAWKAR